MNNRCEKHSHLFYSWNVRKEAANPSDVSISENYSTNSSPPLIPIYQPPAVLQITCHSELHQWAVAGQISWLVVAFSLTGWLHKHFQHRYPYLMQLSIQPHEYLSGWFENSLLCALGCSSECSWKANSKGDPAHSTALVFPAEIRDSEIISLVFLAQGCQVTASWGCHIPVLCAAVSLPSAALLAISCGLILMTTCSPL